MSFSRRGAYESNGLGCDSDCFVNDDGWRCHSILVSKMKGWPYCMKNKKPAKCCKICGTTRDKLLGKSMPGLYKGMCHACYVLERKYGQAGVTRLVRTKITLQRTIYAIA